MPAAKMYMSDILNGQIRSKIKARHVIALAKSILQAFRTLCTKYWLFIGPEGVGFSNEWDEALICTRSSSLVPAAIRLLFGVLPLR
jgi:hypothetical protein